MTILIINETAGYGSTGNIAANQAAELTAQGHNVVLAWGRAKSDKPYDFELHRIGTPLSLRINGVLARIFDNEGLNAKITTRAFLRWADSLEPDMIYLHNLHGYYLNYEQLFAWIKARGIKTEWMLHDCWPLTGHCAFFNGAGCNQWRQGVGCKNCPQLKEYPKTWFLGNVSHNYRAKKEAFSGVKDMKLVVPSKWLADRVGDSILAEYSIEVRHHTVDKEIFRPRPSDFREKYGIGNKKIVLGVASVWEEYKGLSDFLEISRKLPSEYQIVLVGMTKDQIERLPERIIGLTKTENPIQLAEIYSAADVFVHPGKNESFGLTVLEALSCGTKAIAYEDTAPGEVAESYGGIAVEQSIDVLIDSIRRSGLIC